MRWRPLVRSSTLGQSRVAKDMGQYSETWSVLLSMIRHDTSDRFLRFQQSDEDEREQE